MHAHQFFDREIRELKRVGIVRPSTDDFETVANIRHWISDLMCKLYDQMPGRRQPVAL